MSANKTGWRRNRILPNDDWNEDHSCYKCMEKPGTTDTIPAGELHFLVETEEDVFCRICIRHLSEVAREIGRK